MASLKKLQSEKDSGEWESLNEQAREQVNSCIPKLCFILQDQLKGCVE